MSENQSTTKFYDDLPKVVRIILQIVLYGLVNGIYRILRYVDTKTTSTLVCGILCFLPFVGFVIAIIDLISVIKEDKITFYAN